MLEKLPEEERARYRVVIGNRAWGGGPTLRPFSRLERLKFGLMAPLCLTVLLAVLVSAFFIGLILAIPLTVLWMIWMTRIAWRLRMRSRLNRM